MTDLKEHAPGVYIGLPEDDYHADPAIGGSGFKSWVYDPIEWWWESAYCPYRQERKETSAMNMGDAIHKILLEGQAAFDRFYCEKFDPSAYPDALSTADDYKSALKDLGLPRSGKKDDLRERLEASGDYDFMDDLRAEHEAANQGKTFVPKEWLGRLSLYMAIRKRDKRMIELFSEGVPEVSIFWTEGDIRCKARIDWLRADKTVDLKSYADYMAFTKRERIVKNMTNLRYDLQEAHYSRGRRKARDLPVNLVNGTEADLAYVTDAMQTVGADFLFLFVKTTRSPQFSIVDGAVFREAGQYDWQRAMDKLQQLYAHFGGFNDPWVVVSDEVQVEYTEVPSYFGLGTLGAAA